MPHEFNLYISISLFVFCFATMMICPYLLSCTGRLEYLADKRFMQRLSVVTLYDANITHLKRQLAVFFAVFGTNVQLIVVTESAQKELIELTSAYKVQLIQTGEAPLGTSKDFYACYLGAKAARNDLLLFTDSGVAYNKLLFSKLARIFAPGCVVTLMPYLKLRPFSFLPVGRLVFDLISSGSFGIKKRTTANIFTRCMLIDRKDYFNVCTHEMIPNCREENLLLAAAYQRAGLKMRCFTAGILLSSDSYKIGSVFPCGLDGTLFGLAYMLGGLTIFCAFLSSVVLFSAPNFIFTWLYVVYVIVYMFYAKKFCSINILQAALYPISFLFAAFSYLSLFKRKKTSEKQKTLAKNAA